MPFTNQPCDYDINKKVANDIGVLVMAMTATDPQHFISAHNGGSSGGGCGCDGGGGDVVMNVKNRISHLVCQLVI